MSKYDVVTTTTRQISPQGEQTQATDQSQTQTQTTVEYKHVTYDRKMDWCDYLQITLIILIIIVGIIGFIKSVRSRKFFKCPVCGESFKAENMKPETCKICGANLDETEDKNVTDKTK